MTRATAKALILSWLDDPNAGYFTDANLNLWINNAQRQVQQILLQAGQAFYEKPVETSTVVSQADYLLPTDFVVEHRLELVLSNYGTPSEVRQPLQNITTNQQDLIPLALGVPAAYYMKKDRFTVQPIPSNVWTLRLYYSPRVTDLGSDSDNIQVPDDFTEYVCILAAYDGFIKDNSIPSNLEAKRVKYEERLKQMAQDRTQDQPRQVVQKYDFDNIGAFF